jgi:hypothetical protein
MDKALVFGTKDWWFESCQGHAARNARIATPDHVGRLDPLAVAAALQWTLHGVLVMLVGSRDEAMLSAWRVGDKRRFRPATARQSSALPKHLIRIRYSLTG